VEVNSSVGTRYIQWRCLMLPDGMNGNIHGICVEMLMNGIRDCWYNSNASYNINVNVPSFKFNNVEYWYAATSLPPPTTIGSIRIRCTDVIVVRRRCRSSRPIRWSHDKNRETLSSSSDWGLAQSTHQRPVYRLFRAREDAIIVKTSERALDDVAESNNSQYLKKRYNEEIIM